MFSLLILNKNEKISHIPQVLLLLTLNKKMSAGMKIPNRTFFRGIAKSLEKYEPLELETKRLNYDEVHLGRFAQFRIICKVLKG